MTEITLQEAKHQIAKKVGFVHWQWNDLTIFTAPDIEEFEKNLDEAAELYASQYKAELSSKEALIGELKKEKASHAIGFAKFISDLKSSGEEGLDDLTLVDGNWYWAEDKYGDSAISEEQLYEWYLQSLD